MAFRVGYNEVMHDLEVIIGRESSPEELDAVVESFKNDRLDIIVRPNLMRMSQDWQNLPMTIMVFAQALAPNVIWDLIKFATKKLFSDSRLSSRPPTIVIKRKNYDVVVNESGIHIRSFEENLSFNSIDELVLYEKERSQSSQAANKDKS